MATYLQRVGHAEVGYTREGKQIVLATVTGWNNQPIDLPLAPDALQQVQTFVDWQIDRGLFSDLVPSPHGFDFEREKKLREDTLLAALAKHLDIK